MRAVGDVYRMAVVTRQRNVSRSLGREPVRENLWSAHVSRQAFVLRIIGPSVIASKAVGLAALALSLLCLFVACRRRTSVTGATWLVGVASLISLWFLDISFWNRPDPLLLLAVSAALVECECGHAVVAGGGVALALAAAMNLRADAMLSFFPILVVVWRRLGLAVLAWCVMAAVALAFVISAPHISLRGFIAIQMVVAHKGLDARMFRGSLTFGIMLGTLLVSAAHVADRSVVAATAASMVLITVVASSPGTGPHHFMPLLLVLLWLSSAAFATETPRSNQWQQWFGLEVYAAIGITFCLVALPSVQALVAPVRQQVKSGLYLDVREFSRKHDVSCVALGYGSSPAPSFALQEIVLRGGLLPVDAVTAFETNAAGWRTSNAAIEALRSCGVAVWLLPRNETPFSLSNPYTGQPTFDELFRSAFIKTYVRAGSATARLDVWRCRGSPPLPRSHVLCPRMDFHGERSLSAEHLVTMEAKGACGLWKTTCPPQSRYQNL